MRAPIAAVLATAALLLGASALAPPAAPGPAAAQAAVTKSLSGGSGGGGNAAGAGDRFGNLLSGWAVPVITALAGCLLIGALATRNIGASVGIVAISVLALIFLLAPGAIASFAKGIGNLVF